jgi:hypothetical protein
VEEKAVVRPFWERKRIRCFVSDFGKKKEKYKEVLISNGIDWEDENILRI